MNNITESKNPYKRKTIPGTPQPKQRPRRGPNGTWYTPHRTADYEANVRAYALQARVRCFEGPLDVRICCYFPDERRRDVDNVAKSLLDALNGLAWSDDSQVERLAVEKHIDPVTPRAEVEITPIQPSEKVPHDIT